MKNTKENLVAKINRECSNIIIYPKKVQKAVDFILETFNIPAGISSDILTMRVNALDYSEYILFAILYTLDEKHINNYFTNVEIDKYLNTKYTPEIIKFPIKWDMIEVTDTQWIGVISSKELMKLGDAQLIRYNENTQRILTQKILNNVVRFSITINRKAVEAIVKSLLEKNYIPNTITLNLPEEAEYKYSDKQLTIYSTQFLDILDGYHRYVALRNIYSMDEKFDIKMELRVVCFSEEKAKQFIWQEDQKTQMKKIDSESFNQNEPSNQVINLINQTNMFKNIINNNGIMNASIISRLISILFFDNKKNVNRSDIVKTKNIIVEKLNVLLSNNPSILDNNWDNVYTIAAFVLFSEDIPDERLASEIEILYNKCMDPKYKQLFAQMSHRIYPARVQKIKEIYKED